MAKKNIIREHIETLLARNIREDKRKPLEYRKPITVEYGISPKSAEGSARVRIGKTEVVAGIKLGVDKPYPDTPDEGSIMVNAELIPLSNPDFEAGPPSFDSIELSRVVDRGIRESKALNFKKLCIEKGAKAWTVFIDLYSINDEGNLFDACALAAIAALKDAKFPEYDKKTEKINYEKRTNKALPLEKTPVEVTVIKIKDTFLVDPSLNEWKNLDARLTTAFDEKGTICGMQKGGTAGLSIQDIATMVDIASEHAQKLRKALSP